MRTTPELLTEAGFVPSPEPTPDPNVAVWYDEERMERKVEFNRDNHEFVGYLSRAIGHLDVWIEASEEFDDIDSGLPPGTDQCRRCGTVQSSDDVGEVNCAQCAFE